MNTTTTAEPTAKAITATALRETEKAYQVEAEVTGLVNRSWKFWLPKSKVEREGETTFVLPMWLYGAKCEEVAEYVGKAGFVAIDGEYR